MKKSSGLQLIFVQSITDCSHCPSVFTISSTFSSCFSWGQHGLWVQTDLDLHLNSVLWVDDRLSLLMSPDLLLSEILSGTRLNLQVNLVRLGYSRIIPTGYKVHFYIFASISSQVCPSCLFMPSCLKILSFSIFWILHI